MTTRLPLTTPLARASLPVLLGLTFSTGLSAQASFPFTTSEITEFNEPWALEFLPDGRMLVTEKPGSIYLVTQDGEKTEVDGAPEVDYFFQGGLGDIALHPDYADNSVIYVSYVEAGEDDTRGAVVARGTFDASAPAINDLDVIWQAEPKVGGGLHFSYRLLFDDEGNLFVSSGDRNEKDPAQDMSSTMGKIVRLKDDGTPADGNPFTDEEDARAEIWSLGHRNPLGIAFDANGQLWDVEMGPRGGDELNRVEPGNNYGYPVVSNGNEYNGTVIPDHDTVEEDRFTKPALWWNPVISPSSMMLYEGDRFSDWDGNFLIGGLSSMAIIRVEINDNNAAEAARYPMGSRIREVELGPDGYVWYLEDGQGGRLMKMEPR